MCAQTKKEKVQDLQQVKQTSAVLSRFCDRLIPLNCVELRGIIFSILGERQLNGWTGIRRHATRHPRVIQNRTTNSTKGHTHDVQDVGDIGYSVRKLDGFTGSYGEKCSSLTVIVIVFHQRLRWESATTLLHDWLSKSESDMKVYVRVFFLVLLILCLRYGRPS